MKKILTSAAGLMLALGAWAGVPQLTTTTDDGSTVTVEAVNRNTLRVTNAAKGQKSLPTRASVLTEASAPEAQILNNDKNAMRVGSLLVYVLPQTGAVVITDPTTGVSVYDDGTRATDNQGRQTIKLRTGDNRAFFGAGERGHAPAFRGDTLVNYNRQNYGYTGTDPRISQMNITMPLLVGDDGLTIVFDDFMPSTLTTGSNVEYVTENPNAVSYYVILPGNDLNNESAISVASRRLADLTGHQPLPPLWAMGYITSKYGYHDAGETTGVIDTLKREGYPVDGVVLDLYWYGKEQDMGRLAWEPTQWGNHKKMLADLKKRGVNTVIITQPYILRNGRGIDNYNFLRDNGMMVMDSVLSGPQEVKIWVGEGGMFDVSNPATRAWYGNRYRELTDEGVGGWWGDLGEPEVHPQTGRHANGLTARQYHNQYGNDWSSIISELYDSVYPSTRLMTMMRGGTIGLQRYSVYPWSTDVSRSWGGLQPQINIMKHSGLSGLGYMSHDVGGFAVDPANPEDAELYVRWLQLGTFSPILRTHAQYNAEPYHYPQYKDIILPLIKERYRWLPYNYTLAAENAFLGLPLVRPLGYATNQVAKYADINDQYMWGDKVMIAPVLEQGATSRSIVFPEGEWIDYNHPTKAIKGGVTVADYPAPLAEMPMFIQAGSVIPTADYPMQNTRDYKPNRITLNVYCPSENNDEVIGTCSTLYEDDFTTPVVGKSDISYEEEEYFGGAPTVATYQFFSTFKPESTEVMMTTDWEYSSFGTIGSKMMDLDLVFYNVDKRPASVTLDNIAPGNGGLIEKSTKVKFTYDAATATVRVKGIKWNVLKNISVTLHR